MKSRYAFVIFLVSVLNLSFVPIRHMGMLTDDYSIVTAQDLAEEEARSQNLVPFPPKEGSFFQYWQCLPTKEVFIDCEDMSEAMDEDTARPIFWIKNDDQIHHFLTRRNFDFEACRDWKTEWEAVLAGEDIVCLSGEFIDTSGSDEHPSSPAGTHYYWIIDRMKSHHREWSYFYRGPEMRSADAD